jgi:RNA polymerase sigma factor (sigma-70 family)
MPVQDEGTKEKLFQEIVATNQRRIATIARSYARGDEYRDLCQEILLQMWRGLDGFAGRSAHSTWVYRVALNTAITYRRKTVRRVSPAANSLKDASIEPAAPCSAANEIMILDDFLRTLDKVDRAVFLLYLEDLSYQDISEVTGLTAGNVGVRINRLKKAFTQRYCGG